MHIGMEKSLHSSWERTVFTFSDKLHLFIPPIFFFFLYIILYLFTLNFIWHFITLVFYNPVSYRARQNLILRAILSLWWTKYRVASAALNQPWFRPTLGISCQFPTLFPFLQAESCHCYQDFHCIWCCWQWVFLTTLKTSENIPVIHEDKKEAQPADLRYTPCTCTQMGWRPGITWAVPALPGWFLWVIHYYHFGQKIIDKVEESSIIDTTLVSKRELWWSKLTFLFNWKNEN